MATLLSVYYPPQAHASSTLEFCVVVRRPMRHQHGGEPQFSLVDAFALQVCSLAPKVFSLHSPLAASDTSFFDVAAVFILSILLAKVFGKCIFDRTHLPPSAVQRLVCQGPMSSALSDRSLLAPMTFIEWKHAFHILGTGILSHSFFFFFFFLFRVVYTYPS